MMFTVDDAIFAFAAEARRYCEFIEADGTSSPRVFARECLTLVLRLYERILMLPNVDPDSPELPDRIQHSAWQAVRERVVRQLVRDYSWEVFEPFTQKKPEPKYGSISDDLADIWRDIKAGLFAMDKGAATSVEDAAWHWLFSFETHWGHHAAGAIVALTALCCGALAGNTGTQDVAENG